MSFSQYPTTPVLTDTWVQSIPAHIMEETGRDVWRETESPAYIRDA